MNHLAIKPRPLFLSQNPFSSISFRVPSSSSMTPFLTYWSHFDLGLPFQERTLSPMKCYTNMTCWRFIAVLHAYKYLISAATLPYTENTNLMGQLKQPDLGSLSERRSKQLCPYLCMALIWWVHPFYLWILVTLSQDESQNVPGGIRCYGQYELQIQSNYLPDM